MPGPWVLLVLILVATADQSEIKLLSLLHVDAKVNNMNQHINYKDAVIDAVIEGMTGMPEDMIAAFIPMLDLVYTAGFTEALRGTDESMLA